MDRKVVGAAVAAVALAAGGCGSGSSTLSRAEFVKRANAACTQAQTAATRPGGASTRGIEAFANRVMTGLKVESDGFSRLNPPKEMQSTFVAYRQDLAQFEGLVTRYVAAVKARNRTQTEALNRQATALNQQRQAHIRTLGLRNCL